MVTYVETTGELLAMSLVGGAFVCLPRFEVAQALELIEAEGDEDLLFGTAKWSANGKDAQGADQPWAGVTTHVFERQEDGSLKLRVHTFN